MIEKLIGRNKIDIPKPKMSVEESKLDSLFIREFDLNLVNCQCEKLNEASLPEIWLEKIESPLYRNDLFFIIRCRNLSQWKPLSFINCSFFSVVGDSLVNQPLVIDWVNGVEFKIVEFVPDSISCWCK